MAFETTGESTAIEVFDAVYAGANDIITELNEFRKELTPRSERVPGTPLEISFGGNRVDDTDVWHNEYRVRARVPELGGRAVDLLQTTSIVEKSEEPFQVGAWRGGSDIACDFTLTRDRQNKRVSASIRLNNPGGWPTRQEISKVIRYGHGLWLPEGARLSELPASNGQKFELIAERVEALVVALGSLRRGEDPLTVLQSIDYSFSSHQSMALRSYERMVLRPRS